MITSTALTITKSMASLLALPLILTLALLLGGIAPVAAQEPPATPETVETEVIGEEPTDILDESPAPAEAGETTDVGIESTELDDESLAVPKVGETEGVGVESTDLPDGSPEMPTADQDREDSLDDVGHPTTYPIGPRRTRNP